MPIPIGYAKNICQVGQAGCCRYLTLETAGFCCAKRIKGLKEHLDQRVAAGTMNATGDNCPGWTDEQPEV